MSQDNVEVVRRWLEAVSGGSEDFDHALALVNRDVVLVPSPLGPCGPLTRTV
jgi:hypothetical protein